MSDAQTPVRTDGMTTVRYVLVATLIAVAFFATYRFAVAKSTPDDGASGGGVITAAPLGTAGGAGCACCGNSGSGEAIEGSTTVEGDVQRIAVDASAGYAPNVVKAVAGIPLEITFSQGLGCMAEVMSTELGFFEDLTGGPKTVRLPALQAGEYGFSCGMQMVFGTIVVE